jgi:hypothetical protein
VAVPDGAAALLRTIAAAKRTPEVDQLALASAQLPTQAPELFEGKEGAKRADALALMVAHNSQVILETLTPYDRHTAAVDGNTSKIYRENAKTLGSLFDVALFNPDLSASTKSLLQEKVIDYVKEQMKAINQSTEVARTPAGRVAMLQAALLDAVQLGADKNAADKARSQQAMGFLLDLAISALPTGKLVSEPVEQFIKSTLGNPAAAESLKNVWKTGYDQATGKLTAEAKKAVLAKLGEGDRNVQLEVDFQNGIQDIMMQQIANSENDTDAANIEINAEGISTRIDLDRGRPPKTK